jgi:hypothetical protein
MSSIPDNCCPGENDPKAPASKAAPSEIPASLKSKGIEPFTYRGRAAMGAKPSTARVTVVRAIGFQRTGKNPSMFESRYTCNSPDPGGPCDRDRYRGQSDRDDPCLSES